MPQRVMSRATGTAPLLEDGALLELKEVEVAAWWNVQLWWRQDARHKVRKRWELQETTAEKQAGDRGLTMGWTSGSAVEVRSVLGHSAGVVTMMEHYRRPCIH